MATTDFDVERVTLQSDQPPEFTIDMSSVNPRFLEQNVEFRITDIAHKDNLDVMNLDALVREVVLRHFSCKTASLLWNPRPTFGIIIHARQALMSKAYEFLNECETFYQ